MSRAPSTSRLAVLFCILLGLLGVGVLAVALVPPPRGLALEPVAFGRLDGWAGDDHPAALLSFLKSCDRLERLDPDTLYGRGPAARTGRDWIAACTAARATELGDARHFFESRFKAFKAREGRDDRGLLTGYFEPELNASRERRAPYLTPLYVRPPELVTVRLGRFLPELAGRSIMGALDGTELVPFATRADIEDGALARRDLELVWVDDPVAAFFLEVQGSGRVRFRDGEMWRVGYAGKNGQPYTSIGRVLIERGEILPENMSLPALQDWLAANPQEARDVLRQNESYVFFRRLDGDGPLGSQGVVLSPGRSLAVDRTVWPMGMPVWLDGVLPEAVAGTDQPLRRLVVAQDTGGAIRGALRGDLFWGPGERAAALAGHMKERARFVMLLPRAHDGFTGQDR